MEKTSTDGELTWGEKLGLSGTLLRWPIVLVFRLLTSPWSSAYKKKTWRRVWTDTFFRYLTSTLNVRQLQSNLGPTLVTYKNWVRQRKLQFVIEDIGEGARILWLGPKRTDRVVLYFHGGGYLIPMQDYSLPFLRYLQLQLQERSLDVGVALLNYSLAPNAPFPTQLRQATAALDHLLRQGVNPARIQLMGDSAGANLILQLLSHLLHPHPSIAPPPVLQERIGGAFLLSPCVTYLPRGSTFASNDHKDVLSSQTLTEWGSFVRADVPEDQLAYAEPITASPEWWTGSGERMSRFLITAGDAECFEADIAAFTKVFAASLQDGQLTSVVQKGGVHNDSLLDFSAGESKLGSLTPVIVEWFAEGFRD